MAAFVSVVIPVYNTEPYLEECVWSVLRQTYPDLELILVDDGSDDGSRELCERLSREDRRIRVLSQEHRGVSAARNAAISAPSMQASSECGQSAGEYLFFLDSDDSIHPELLQKLCSLAEKTNAAIVSSDLLWVRESVQIPVEEETQEEKYIYLDNQTALNSFCTTVEGGKLLGTLGGKLVRRGALKALLFDETMGRGEDTKFLYQILEQGADVAILQRKWYYYRQRQSSASHIKTPESCYDCYQCYQYISGLELAQGRTVSAILMEQYAVDYLVKGYCVSRLEHNKQSTVFGRKLGRSELKAPAFSLLAPTNRVRIFLAFYCYPLYLFLSWTLRMLRKGKRRCAAWLKKTSAPAAGYAEQSAR